MAEMMPAQFGAKQVGPSQDQRATPAFCAFEWLIAWRYLRARRKEGAFSVIAGFSFVGILLGVAALIIVLAVMNGFRKELTSKILGVNGHLLVQAIDQPFVDFEEVVARFKTVTGVRQIIPFVEGQGFASGQGHGLGSGVLVRGVRESDLLSMSAITDNIRMGSLDDFDERGGLVIGRRMANSLGVQVGDNVTLLGPDGPRTPFGTTPRRKAYSVTAIFEVGMSDLDGILAFMPLSEAQAFYNQPNRVTAIEVYLDQPERIDKIREALSNAVERPIYIGDWRQRNAALFNALQIERNVMFLILTLIVLVAALNIISGLIMLVKDKAHDIAILRTMGATRGTILRVFLIVGASIGVVGTVGGLLLGLLVCARIQAIQEFVSYLSGTNLWDPTVRFLTQIPADVDRGETLSVLLMALTLSLLATLYPSWRAAKLDPVEALRYE